MQKQHLISVFSGERENLNSESDITIDLLKDYVATVESNINELGNQNKCLDLQLTFRPIFADYFRANLFNRYKAVTYRRVLAENGYDFNGLEEIWKTKGKVNFSQSYQCLLVASLSLCLIFFSHFLGWFGGGCFEIGRV